MTDKVEVTRNGVEATKILLSATLKRGIWIGISGANAVVMTIFFVFGMGWFNFLIAAANIGFVLFYWNLHKTLLKLIDSVEVSK